MSRTRTLCLALCFLAAAAAAAEDEPQEGSPSEAKSGAGEGAPASEDAPKNAAPAIEEAPVTVPAEVFEEGMKAFRAGDTMRAAEKLWHYLSGNEPVADHYEWAELYLARSLEKEGLSQAAIEYLYNVIKERKRPELLPEALRDLERLMETTPYDRQLLEEDLLGSSPFGALPPDTRAFVEYHQARLALLEGRDKWAERHFDRLERIGEKHAKAKRYLFRARYLRAVRDLTETHARDTRAKIEKRNAARKSLLEIATSEEVDDLDLKNDARRQVARLYFEEQRFAEALAMYEAIEVPFLSLEEATLFLEKAWTRYYAGDPRGTLGILLSLEAPSYRRYFKPERFVLKALAYQSLCHYASAKGAAREFLRRYGDALSELRLRRQPLAHPVVRRAAVQAAGPRRALALLETLQAERQRVERFSDEHGLRAHLARIYDLKIAEVVRRLDDEVREEAIRVAGELLDYEEQARLVDYEVSLEVFRRLKKGTGRKVADLEPPIPLASKKVYFRFDDEYWNDELFDYRFRIENRCFGGELFE